MKVVKISVVIVALTLFVTWMFHIIYLRSSYYDRVNLDPLAMISVLFPNFWIILLAFFLNGFIVFYLEYDSRWLHIFLLAQLSIMLYFTPFLLANFSWSPDSLWHGGIADYIPEILAGSNLPLSNYAKSYPCSFILTYCAKCIMGVDIFIFTLYFYPIFFLISFTIATYVFITRLLNSKVAFITMLLALPTLHHIEPHVSPFSMGTILVLEIFILLTISGKASNALKFLLTLFLVLTHPVSPLAIGILVFVSLLTQILYKKSEKIQNLTFLFIFIAITWSLWTIFRTITTHLGVKYPLLSLLKFNFIHRLIYATEWTVSKGFLYSNIHQLSLVIYLILFVIVWFSLSSSLTGLIRKKNYSNTLTFSLSSIFYVILGYLLFLTSTERFLLGRGLIFYILFSSICVSVYIVKLINHRKILAGFITVLLICFLAISFPIISYSKESYNSFTPKADSGLRFVATKLDMKRFSISMGADQQLVAYINLSSELRFIEFPPNLSSIAPDYIVLRITSYFSISLRSDLSLENNTFTLLRKRLETIPSYNKIYTSSGFDIYCNINTTVNNQ